MEKKGIRRKEKGIWEMCTKFNRNFQQRAGSKVLVTGALGQFKPRTQRKTPAVKRQRGGSQGLSGQ